MEFLQIAAVHRDIENKRDNIANVLLNELIVPLSKKTDNDKKNVAKLEDAFRKRTQEMRGNIKDAEKQSEKVSKTAKKTGGANNELQQVSSTQRERVTKHEMM